MEEWINAARISASRRVESRHQLVSISRSCVHLTMPWVVSFSITSHFGPFPVNTMLRAGDAVAERGDGAGEKVAGGSAGGFE